MLEQLSSVGLNNINSFVESTKSYNQVQSSGEIFEGFLQAGNKLIEETNDYQIAAQQAQLDFVTGKSDNLVTVLMAQQSAQTSINFTVQVTNKVIDAYKELMQIQL